MWRIILIVCCVLVVDAVLYFLAVGATFDYECSELMRLGWYTDDPTPENLEKYNRVRIAKAVAERRAEVQFGGLMLLVTGTGFFIVGRQSTRRLKTTTSPPLNDV